MPSIKTTASSIESPKEHGGIESSHKHGDACSSLTSSISSYAYDICRICHCEGDAEVPLITPCYCAGSLRFVHQACLQQWIKSSNTRNCELCKFQFIMHTKTKPFTEWEQLDMSGLERRKLFCAVLFHAVALTCVVWSSYVLIDRTVEEVRNGVLEWPLWTKLIVVSIGITGGVIFMYIQCKAYIQICQRWKAYNRVIYVQDAPPRIPTVTVLSAIAASSNNDGSSHAAEVMNSDALMRPLYDCQWKPYQDNFDCQTFKHGAPDGGGGEATSIDFKGVRNVRIFFDNDKSNGIHLSKGDDCVSVNVNDLSHAATSSGNKSSVADAAICHQKTDGDHSTTWRIEINKTGLKNNPSENVSNLNDTYDKVLPPIDSTDSNSRDLIKTSAVTAGSSLQGRTNNEGNSPSSSELPVLKLLIKIADIVIQFGGQTTVTSPSASGSDTVPGDEKTLVSNVSKVIKSNGCDDKSLNVRIDDNFDNSNDQTPFIAETQPFVIDITSQVEQKPTSAPSNSSNPVEIRFDFGAENNSAGGDSDKDSSLGKSTNAILLSDSDFKNDSSEEPSFSNFVSYSNNLEPQSKNDSSQGPSFSNFISYSNNLDPQLKNDSSEEPSFSNFISYSNNLEFKNDSESHLSFNESNDSCSQLLLKQSDDESTVNKVS